jgi:sugar lactone lactonase YvrE
MPGFMENKNNKITGYLSMNRSFFRKSFFELVIQQFKFFRGKIVPVVLIHTPRMKVSLLSLFLCLFLFSLAAQQTDNYQIQVVPAPGPVKIDGKLNDWDTSGKILSCYDLGTLLETNSVITSVMYDSQYLYFSFQFKDKTPMLNKVDPASDPGSGWKSDCVQLRLWTDHQKPTIGPPNGSLLLHIDCYWFSPEKKPVAYVVYHNMKLRKKGFEKAIPHAIGKGIDAAFSINPDKSGYTQEMRIAWSLLRRNGLPFKAGQTLRMGIEYIWGDSTASKWPSHRYADVVNQACPQRKFFWSNYDAWGTLHFLDHGNLSARPQQSNAAKIDEYIKNLYKTQGAVPIKYTIPEDGSVTLVIEKLNGERVRNLISNYPRKKGENIDYWDGLDDDGKPVPAGEYQVRGLFHDKLDVLYKFSYGSPGQPTWETSDGSGGWLGDHEMPVGIATNGKWIYISAFCSEDGNTIIGLDETGTKQWGISRIQGGAICVSGDYVYMLAGGGHPQDRLGDKINLLRINKKNGRIIPFKNGQDELTIFKYPQNRKVKIREWEGKHIAEKSFDADWLQRESAGVTAINGKLYVSLFYENKVIKIDPETGKTEAEYDIKTPVGLAGDKNGGLYAISGRRIMKLSPDGTFKPFTGEIFDAPLGLCVDNDGYVYVSDWGASMNVKVLSSAGELVRVIGKKGGRPLSGSYDADGMFRPLGIAVDNWKRLWVAEYDCSPKRISVWQPDGKLFREFCGPTWYGATECNINNLNPDQAFCSGNTLDVDWPQGCWRVAGTLWRPTKGNALLGPRKEGLAFQVVKCLGRTFLVASMNRFICISELKDGKARPLVALGDAGRIFLNNQARYPEMVAKKLWDDPKKLTQMKIKYPTLFNGGAKHRHRLFHKMIKSGDRSGNPVKYQFLWTDTNGDGLCQDNEWKFFHPDEMNGLKIDNDWLFACSPDLTLYPQGNVKKKTKVWKLPVSKWNSCGAPVYDLGKAELISETSPSIYCNSTWADEDSVLLNQSPLTMISSSGRQLWTYPNKWPGVQGSHTAPKDQNGLMIGPLRVIGAVDIKGFGRVICLNSNMGKALLISKDGLYIGSLFVDNRAAPDAPPKSPLPGNSFKRMTTRSEWFGGEFLRNINDGKIYIGASMSLAQSVFEVKGLDSVKRIPVSKVYLTEKLREKCLSKLNNKKEEKRKRPELVVSAQKQNNLSDVKKSPVFARWRYDAKREAEATWTFDDKYLYVSFKRIRDTTPMINHGKHLKRLFKTGDAAVFEIRTVPNNFSKDVIKGDIRLLLSEFENKPVAVLYQYKSDDQSNQDVFSSPVTTTRVDKVIALKSAKVSFQKGKNGYSVEAKIPLADVGFFPKRGQAYLGDFGIIYSDALGRLNELRMNWANPETGLVSDLALEARITPGNWGLFKISDK